MVDFPVLETAEAAVGLLELTECAADATDRTAGWPAKPLCDVVMASDS
jgi:hypothetical protein